MLRLGVRGKLLASFGTVFLLFGVLSVILFVQISSLGSTVAVLGDQTVPQAAAIGGLHLGVAEYHRDQLNYLAAPSAKERTDAMAELTKHQGEVTAAFTDLAASGLTSAEQAPLQVAQADWTKYQSQTSGFTALVDSGDTAGATALLFGDAATTMDAFDTDLDATSAVVATGATVDAGSARNSVSLLQMLQVLGMLAVVIVGSALALFISRSITTGVKAIQAQMGNMREGVGGLAECFTRLSQNDLTASYTSHVPLLEFKSSDEIGATAVMSNELLGGLKTMANAYETARQNLSAALGEVKDAAVSVAQTSAELTNAANQSGSASGQIARTIGQVASGAQEQAQAASSTSHSVMDLTNAIGEVGTGAAETTRKVDASAAAVSRLVGAIEAAGKASTEVGTVSAEAAAAAAGGLTAVHKTVTGMGRIKDAVDASAAKVAELGTKSDQIGAIVETIDDIAEQTNLLALNAAIEAARAGEQGKGFAVVADEVRKLAERSSRATREIADLIAEVQRETDAAVAAMAVGSAEVAAGAGLADEAGAALEAIATSVTATKSAVERISVAVAAMNDASGGVASASGSIEAIAAHTNDSAARMTASAGAVAQAVQSIAAVSEENSAAAEEVSAATEELSAQVEEVVASAATLAEMASNLDSLVARFTLPGSSESGPVDASTEFERRRGSASRRSMAA
jgi:methyl-accepting chemotaxis protein